MMAFVGSLVYAWRQSGNSGRALAIFALIALSAAVYYEPIIRNLVGALIFLSGSIAVFVWLAEGHPSSTRSVFWGRWRR